MLISDHHRFSVDNEGDMPTSTVFRNPASPQAHDHIIHKELNYASRRVSYNARASPIAHIEANKMA